MENYTEFVINNKIAKNSAKSLQTKNNLRNKLYNLTGYKAPKNLSIKFLKEQIIYNGGNF